MTEFMQEAEEDIVIPETEVVEDSEQDPIDDVDTLVDDEVDELQGIEEEDDGDSTPQEEPTVKKSKKTKEHTAQEKADYKFAEMRRKLAEAEAKLEEKLRKEEEANEFYRQKAKESGNEDIQNEADFRNAMIEAEKIALMQDAYDITEEQAKKRLKLEKLNKPSVPVQPVRQNQINPVLEQRLNKEVLELNEAYDTDLDSYNDILSLPNAEKILRVLKADPDLTIRDGYEIANRDLIKNKLNKKTKQSTINDLNGYNHVKDSAGNSKVNPNTATQAQIGIWRNFYPDKSVKELSQMITNFNKQT